MSTKDSEALIQEFETVPGSATGGTPDRLPSMHGYMLDKDRIAAYITLSGLLDANIDMETALLIVTTEYKAQSKSLFSNVIGEFFTKVMNIRKQERENPGKGGDKIGELADRVFTKELLKTEEIILLRGLAYTDDISSILKAAAKVIQALEETTTAPPLRRR